MPKTKQMWKLEQSEKDRGVLELYIYGDVEGDDRDWWTGQMIESETSANYFRETLAAYPNVKAIHIYINSYGGSVFEGTAIYNQLKRHPAEKVVYVDGFACSVASVIAMAGDRVIMPKNAMMMIHNAWSYVCGNAAELRKAADDLDTINRGNRQAYLQKVGNRLTEDQLVAMLDEEKWLTAEECIEYGFADTYADQDADITKMEDMLQKVNLQFQQRLMIQQSMAKQLRSLTEPNHEKQEPEKRESTLLQLFSHLVEEE